MSGFDITHDDEAHHTCKDVPSLPLRLLVYGRPVFFAFTRRTVDTSNEAPLGDELGLFAIRLVSLPLLPGYFPTLGFDFVGGV